MGNELISIITPFKNSSKYLDECLNSIINQSYKDWELIIVDDYSTDKSFEIVKEFAFIDKRIKLYRNNKKGIIGALKLGYNLSVGKYITRMDSDDVMHVDKLQELCHNLKKKGNGFLATSAVKYFSSNRLGNGYKNYQNWINWLMMKNNHFEHIYKECVIPSPNWMISRKDFDKIEFSFFSISISNTSKDKPSPSAKSTKPLRSAKANSLITPGAFITLKFSIFSFELDFESSIIEV